MKAKSRDYRKLQRAIKNFNCALHSGISYGNGLLEIQLKTMHLKRSYDKKYLQQLPIFTVTYNPNKSWKS